MAMLASKQAISSAARSKVVRYKLPGLAQDVVVDIGDVAAPPWSRGQDHAGAAEASSKVRHTWAMANVPGAASCRCVMPHECMVTSGHRFEGHELLHGGVAETHHLGGAPDGLDGPSTPRRNVL